MTRRPVAEGDSVPADAREARHGVARPAVRGTRRAAGTAAALLAAGLLAPGWLAANGGTQRVADAPVGAYRVSVYTDPTPPRPDSVDVSVLVVRPGTPGTVDGLRVTVTVSPLGPDREPRGDATPRVAPATREAADDPRYYAAKLDPGLDGPGAVRVAVRIEGPDGEGDVGFELDLREPGPLERPLVVLLLALLPVAAAAWWLMRGGPESEEAPTR